MQEVITARLQDTLKKSGSSLTTQRMAIFKSFDSRATLNMSQLCNLLPDVDRATVYRNVNLFEDLGIITRIQIGWKHKLELSDQFAEHHHHLTCTNCHKSIDVEDSQNLDALLGQLTKQNGYVPQGHHVELQGLCPNCQKLVTA